MAIAVVSGLEASDSCDFTYDFTPAIVKHKCACCGSLLPDDRAIQYSATSRNTCATQRALRAMIGQPVGTSSAPEMLLQLEPLKHGGHEEAKRAEMPRAFESAAWTIV